MILRELNVYLVNSLLDEIADATGFLVCSLVLRVIEAIGLCKNQKKQKTYC